MGRRSVRGIVLTRGVAVAVVAACTAAAMSVAPGAWAAAPRAGDAPLYVSDYTAGQVFERPADGGGIRTVATVGLTRPTGLAADAAGDLFVADTGNGRVVEVPAGGGPQVTLPTTGLDRPLGLALDAAGDLYIADSFNNRVVELPAGGGPQTTVPAVGLLQPNGVAVSAAGDLYIADFSDNRVVELPAGGGPQVTVPTTGLAGPTGLAVNTAGDLYISDNGNDRVIEIPAGGGPQTTVPTVGLDRPQGLAVAVRGTLFIASFGNDRVLRVPADGGGQTVVPTRGLTTPADLAIPPAPAPPSGVTAIDGGGRATVSFTPSASPSVTGYTVTATDLTHPSRSGRTAQGAGSPITVEGLTPGDTYTFTVTATNAADATGLDSAPSAPVTIGRDRSARTRLTAWPADARFTFRPPSLGIRGLAAVLRTADGRPLSGRHVTFSDASRRHRLCTAVTNGRGVARCSLVLRGRFPSPAGLLRDLRRDGYRATFAGAASYRPSSDVAPVRVWRRR